MANLHRSPFLPARRLAPALLLFLALSGLASGCRHRPERPPREDPGRISLPTLDGGVTYLGEGREDLLVVSFFATWCMPCLAEIPYLKALHRRPGVRVVAISLDEGGPAVLRPFRDHYQIDYPILLSDADMREGRSAFGLIPGIPATFLFDRQREVHAAILGGIAPANFDPLLEAAAKK